jgi:DNA polymerase-3 subunit epsilon
MEIFHARERRDLAAAVRFYCGHEHVGAHGAAADALATAKVFDAILARYTDLPKTVAELYEGFRDPKAVDLERCFVQVGGRLVFNFGKHRGRPLEAVAREQPDYLRWILGEAFFEDAKSLVQAALQQLQEHPESAAQV